MSPTVSLGTAPNPYPNTGRFATSRSTMPHIVILTAADGFGSGTTAWGPGTCRWDGRDNAGRRVPSGTYWLRLRGSAQQGGSTAIAWERVASR